MEIQKNKPYMSHRKLLQVTEIAHQQELGMVLPVKTVCHFNQALQ